MFSVIEVKLASCKYLDGLPTSGNKLGRAFRDLEWEEPDFRHWETSHRERL